MNKPSSWERKLTDLSSRNIVDYKHFYHSSKASHKYQRYNTISQVAVYLQNKVERLTILGMDKLFLCLYIQNGLNLRLLPVNYICCEDAMNAFISSSLGSSIMYFRTKMLGSNPAVAYFTIVSTFSVQSSFEAEAVSHFQFQWLVNKFTSNTIFNIKTKCARNRNFVHILFFSSFLSFSWTGGKRNGLPPSINLLFFIIKAGFSMKSRKRDEFPVS